MRNILVVGGGIVGLATAYRAGQRYPDATITVLEKEIAVGRHQSGHNSGVLHAGLYYKPGSVKARLAVQGIRQMIAFCQENGIAHQICGKLVVATEEEEIPRLHDLLDRGQKNGLTGLQLLTPDQMREIEPHVAGIAAIRVPEEGIVDYPQVCEILRSKVRGSVVLNARVTGLRRVDGKWLAETTAGEFSGDWLINCAGLHCDRVGELAGIQRDLRIVPFRGEYYTIRPERAYLVRNLIYPVPDPKFPFLGVHFTRMIHGGVEAGPNAVLAFAREGYRKTDINLRDLFDALSYPGLWNFVRRYPRMCLAELRRSFSRELFCAALQRLVPEIQPEDLSSGSAGVRAQALTSRGDLVQDFAIVESEAAVHVLNAPSPGATASLAIAEEIVSHLPVAPRT
ncbi:MAG TPA: L-2-hydroxyglutarate oxidase [Bryobacteraceae bacterium]|nr:L-2-hydroxyglutarate oxidase [Bryobacteraceae bacterium]